MERYWFIYDGTGQYRAVLVGTWCYWVSRRRYWLIHDGTGPVCGNIFWYLVVLDQYRAEMVDTWWYWVCILSVRAEMIWVSGLKTLQ